MPDKTISGLDPAGPLTGGENVPIEQGGTTRRTSAGSIAVEAGVWEYVAALDTLHPRAAVTTPLKHLVAHADGDATDPASISFTLDDNAGMNLALALSQSTGTAAVQSADTGGSGRNASMTVTYIGRVTITGDDGAGGTFTIDNAVPGRLTIAASTYVAINSHIATNQTVTATGPVGTIVAKVAIYNNLNTLIGYIPIYNTIT